RSHHHERAAAKGFNVPGGTAREPLAVPCTVNWGNCWLNPFSSARVDAFLASPYSPRHARAAEDVWRVKRGYPREPVLPANRILNSYVPARIYRPAVVV